MGLPITYAGGGSQFLFATVSAGTNSHLTRIDLTTGEGTIFGKTVNLYQSHHQAQ